MDRTLVDIEEIATNLLNYIKGRKDGSYTGHCTIEENLQILHDLTGTALQKAKIDPEWNKKPFQS